MQARLQSQMLHEPPLGSSTASKMPHALRARTPTLEANQGPAAGHPPPGADTELTHKRRGSTDKGASHSQTSLVKRTTTANKLLPPVLPPNPAPPLKPLPEPLPVRTLKTNLADVKDATLKAQKPAPAEAPPRPTKASVVRGGRGGGRGRGAKAPRASLVPLVCARLLPIEEMAVAGRARAGTQVQFAWSRTGKILSESPCLCLFIKPNVMHA